MRSLAFGIGSVAAVLLAGAASADSNATRPQVAKHILPGTFSAPVTFSVSKLGRSIDLEKVYTRETWDLTVKNTGTQPSREIYIPFKKEQVEQIGRFAAHESGVKSRTYQTEALGDEGESTVEYYRITVDEAIPPKAEKSIRITFSHLAALQPLPARIEQSDIQYLQYTTSAYALSAYPIESQTLSFSFSSGSRITDYTTKAGIEPKKSSRKLDYGPFKSVDALSHEHITVRYESTHAVLHASLLERDVEVSHWGGNVAIEERYWLENLGAKLKNQYSRLQWAMQLYQKGPTNALTELRIPLHGGAADAYFTDDIGNVSTSRFWTNARAAELTLKPRYPLFGGWKYSFRIGWNIDAQAYVRRAKTGSGYVLKLPFLEGPKIAEGVEYEQVQIRAILPEGSRNIRFATSVPLVANSTSLHSTFMDTIGRPTLTLTARNLIDEVRNADLIVTYDLPWGSEYRKPLAVASAVFAVFAVAWVVGNVDTSIGRKTVVGK